MSHPLSSYTNLVEALDVASLPPQDQEALFLELHTLIFRGTMMRLIERMDDATRNEFTRLMESDASESVLEAFLKERVPGADEALAETVAELTDDILAVTGTNTK